MTGKPSINNMSSSPVSAGTRTHFGSPSTNPTVMSPECGSTAPVYIPLANPTIAARRNLAVPNVADPQHLSPTAEEFTPVASNAAFPQPATMRVDGPRGIPRSAFGIPKQSAKPGIIGDPMLNTRTMPARALAAALQPQGISIGKFTVDEQFCRAFVVWGLDPTETASNYGYVAASYQNFGSLVNINAKHLRNGSFAVEFHDIAEAKEALHLTNHFMFRNLKIRCFFQTAKDIAIASGFDPHLVSNHQAEYLVHIIDLGKAESVIDYNKVIEACEKCGPVKAFASVPPVSGAHMTYRIEFYDARTNVNSLSGALLCGFRVCIEANTPDVSRLPTTQEPFNDPAHFNAVMGYYSAPKPRDVALSPGANHNVVDLMKIYLGQDVRTTIMLRNIPNRVDQGALKELLDQTSKGDYDFMYLRIDFANDCNVGYAFINFVDPMAIVPFAKARAGQKWNLFQSDKVAEISYATIQGRDCLIQKFRNSSVMMERDNYKPKLYKVGTGEPEPFPKPDNAFKLRRSLDNAETVGLYRLNHIHGPVPSQVVETPIRAPRNQLPGGVYNVPAQSRMAFHVKTVTDNQVVIPSTSALRITLNTHPMMHGSQSAVAPRAYKNAGFFNKS